jgi:hypothetical protein
MAGILELLIRPQKMAMHDRKAMELQTAKEILAEVFGVRISEVDEMIANRFSDCPMAPGVPAGGVRPCQPHAHRIFEGGH